MWVQSIIFFVFGKYSQASKNKIITLTDRQRDRQTDFSTNIRVINGVHNLEEAINLSISLESLYTPLLGLENGPITLKQP